VLRPRLRRIDERCARTRIANSALVPVVRQFGQQLLQLQSSTNSLRLQDAVLDLACIMLELDDPSSNLELARPHLADLTHERLQAYIARHLRDPELDAEQAARALRISVRYVHKVFQAKGTTFGRELIEARLTEARRLLCQAIDGRAHGVTIGQVAYACGFSNQAHFSARFRERFGVTPRQIAARSR
jgi:AraC family transcriptional regulator, positive regulator of tynA and feaB